MRNMVRAVNHRRTSAEPKQFNQHWVRTPQQNAGRNTRICLSTLEEHVQKSSRTNQVEQRDK